MNTSCYFKTKIKNLTGGQVASHADILLARHAIFPLEERLRDEPKECLHGRLEDRRLT